MTKEPLPGHAIPDDADVRATIGYISEHIARWLTLRLALTIAGIAAVGGLLVHGVPDALRLASVVAGGSSFLAVLVLGVNGTATRRRQWATILTILFVCGGLLATLLSQN